MEAKSRVALLAFAVPHFALESCFQLQSAGLETTTTQRQSPLLQLRVQLNSSSFS
jgi:hypothetical protein